MPFVFVFVLGVVFGFGLAVMWQRILKEREEAEQAKVARAANKKKR